MSLIRKILNNISLTLEDLLQEYINEKIISHLEKNMLDFNLEKTVSDKNIQTVLDTFKIINKDLNIKKITDNLLLLETFVNNNTLTIPNNDMYLITIISVLIILGNIDITTITKSLLFNQMSQLINNITNLMPKVTNTITTNKNITVLSVISICASNYVINVNNFINNLQNTRDSFKKSVDDINVPLNTASNDVDILSNASLFADTLYNLAIKSKNTIIVSQLNTNNNDIILKNIKDAISLSIKTSLNLLLLPSTLTDSISASSVAIIENNKDKIFSNDTTITTSINTALKTTITNLLNAAMMNATITNRNKINIITINYTVSSAQLAFNTSISAYSSSMYGLDVYACSAAKILADNLLEKTKTKYSISGNNLNISDISTAVLLNFYCKFSNDNIKPDRTQNIKDAIKNASDSAFTSSKRAIDSNITSNINIGISNIFADACISAFTAKNLIDYEIDKNNYNLIQPNNVASVIFNNAADIVYSIGDLSNNCKKLVYFSRSYVLDKTTNDYFNARLKIKQQFIDSFNSAKKYISDYNSNKDNNKVDFIKTTNDSNLNNTISIYNKLDFNYLQLLVIAFIYLSNKDCTFIL